LFNGIGLARGKEQDPFGLDVPVQGRKQISGSVPPVIMAAAPGLSQTHQV
jgi:hypothetical protein